VFGACLGESGAFDEIQCSVFIPLQCSVFSVQCSVFIPRTHHSDPEPNWYIYHSDHLGSSAFLTDAAGDPTQHLQYMPFGENFIEQRSVTSYYTPYTFSAKERDTETGYSYFGARYYDADISVWLSVDPMADERSWLSPYNYCQWNPMVLIDTDGNLDDWYLNEKTGELYFNKDLHTPSTTYNGNTYKRIGDNKMLGDMGTTKERAYSKQQSQDLVQRHNYKIVPVQIFVFTETFINYVPTDGQGRSIRTEGGVTISINEKYSIAKSGTFPVRKSVIDVTKTTLLDVILSFLLGRTISATRREYQYITKSQKPEETQQKHDGYSRKTYNNWLEYEKETESNGKLLKYKI